MNGSARGRRKESIMQVEFFWDTAVASVVFSLLILVALDFAIESLRGSEVVCSPPYANTTTAEVNYINHFCTSNYLPFGVHISTATFILGILLFFPHYMWSYHYSGSISLFFQLVGTLQRTEDDSSNHSINDVIMVKELEILFSSSSMFYSYILKLLFQLILVIIGFVSAIVIFQGEFDPTFMCHHTFDDLWPIYTDVTCVFHPLNLLKALWIADILLLLLGGCFLVAALIWCLNSHPNELGSNNIASFLYHYGLPSKYHVSKGFVFNCSGSIFQQFIRRYSCSEPRIRTNLDFLIMKLYSADSILGGILTGIQIRNINKELCEDDRRRLNIHARKHRNVLDDDSNG